MACCSHTCYLIHINSRFEWGLLNKHLLTWVCVFQMYFNTVLTDSAKLLKPLLVFSFVMLAILAGLTRIIQFRNHPVDVYCGWVLGAAIAVYLVKVTVTFITMKHESNIWKNNISHYTICYCSRLTPASEGKIKTLVYLSEKITFCLWA